MIPLASSLTAHQQSLRRLPAISLTVTPSRFGIPTLHLSPTFAQAETERPHAAAFAPDGTFVQVANRAGSLAVRLDFGSWTTIDTISSGNPVAIAATSTELTILAGHGTALKRWHSTTNGSSWTSASTIVTEASAISAVALAANPTGNLCAFYVLNSTSTLKRLRRTSGTWAGSGTTWTRTAEWNDVSGCAAVRNGGQFVVIVTGTEATTLRPTVAAYAMGDGSLPSNVWFGPELVLQADAASTITYAAPFVAAIGTAPIATFTATQTADVAYTGRIWLTQTADPTGLLTWREPTPTTLTGAHGASVAVADLATSLATLSAAQESPATEPLDLSPFLQSLNWKTTPTSSRARIRLAVEPHADVAALRELLLIGDGLEIALGYRSGTAGAPQYGLTTALAIESVTADVAAGSATITIDAIGPWETLDQWQSPQAWQAPTGLTRGGIFEYIAGRAGLTIALGSGPFAPSDAWTNHQPAFAIAAGETGGSVLRRLLAPTADFMRSESTFIAVGLDPTQTTAYTYGVAHPIAAASLTTEAAPNWFRVQGPTRYADAFAPQEPNAVGPRLRTLRELSATSDALATEYAAAALARVRQSAERATITVPANVGAQLYDPVAVTFPALGLADAPFRIIGITLDYNRTTGPARYAQTLTLGDR